MNGEEELELLRDTAIAFSPLFRRLLLQLRTVVVCEIAIAIRWMGVKRRRQTGEIVIYSTNQQTLYQVMG